MSDKTPGTPRRFAVAAAESGQELQSILAARLGISRRRAKDLLDRRACLVNGCRVWMARHPVPAGALVEITETETGPQTDRTDEAIPVLHRDDDLLVVNKPAGCLTTEGDSLEARLRERFPRLDLRAAHRLDRDTSGCVLLAAHADALTAATALFRRREVTKTYRALAAGWVRPARFTLRSAIDGEPAVTEVRVLHASAEASHLEIHIATGRTHQIRRHLARAGHPVLGDRQYGSGPLGAAQRAAGRQMLHAARLCFAHPLRDVRVDANAPLPGDFLALVERLRLR